MEKGKTERRPKSEYYLLSLHSLEYVGSFDNDSMHIEKAFLYAACILILPESQGNKK